MDPQKKILDQINILEAAARQMLEECHKTKQLLGGVYPPTARKGKAVQADAIFQKLKTARYKRLGITI